MPKPKAVERHSRGNSLPNAASSTMNEQPDRPKPISTPAETSSTGPLVGVSHQRKAGGIHQRAGAQHARGAEAVGDDAGERLADAPQQILQRQREGENVAAPMIGARHRREEKAERRARPKRHHRDQAAEADDQRPACAMTRRSGSQQLPKLMFMSPRRKLQFRNPRSIERGRESPKRKLRPAKPRRAWLLRASRAWVCQVCLQW